MTLDNVRRLISDIERTTTVPRSNGEPIFDSPWESRAFGIAVHLSLDGAFEWDEFRHSLIKEVGDWERTHEGDGWNSYERWLAALEDVLRENKVISTAELDALEASDSLGGGA